MRLLITACAILVLVTGCDEDKKRFNGYLDADLIYLSSNTPGRIAQLTVTRGEPVNKDQLLFKIEQTSRELAVQISKLSQQNIENQQKQIASEFRYAKKNLERIRSMRSHDAASQNDLDLAKKDLQVLQDKLAAIDTQIQSSLLITADKQWDMEHTQGYALEKGLIFDTYFSKGEYIQAGQPIVSLLTAKKIKAVFYAAEPDLQHINLGDRIDIASNGYHLAQGVVNYVAKVAQYTPPIIYSREESHNLVFRVEAGIEQPDLNHLHIGQPISLELIR